MASVSLLQLLDDAIGTPEVNVNLEALRKLLKIMLDRLHLLDRGDVPPLAAKEYEPARSHPDRQEGRTEAGARGKEQQPQQQGKQLSGKDLLQGAGSGPPVTSVAPDREETEAKESGISDTEAPPSPRDAPLKMPPPSSEATAVSWDPREDMAGMKATQSHMEEEIQRIKEALGQATDLFKDLHKEVDEMKATQSHMGEDVQMIQKALGQGNLQDAAGQPLALSDQSALTKPHTSDTDTLGACPDNQSTTPEIQTGGPSAQSGTTRKQLESQADHPALEGITRDLSELQGQVSSLQGLTSDLQSLASDLQHLASDLQRLASDQEGEKEKIRQLEDVLGKLHMADGKDQISLLGSALQEIRQEKKMLREEQNIIKDTLKLLVTDKQLQNQLDELRAMVSIGQKQAEAAIPDHSSDTKLLKKLLHNCEKLQKQVDSLVPQRMQGSLPQKSQEQDENLLKSIQATVVRVEGDCEQLSYVMGSLRDDHRQQQKDIEALFRSLESLEKKADKEDLLSLKEDKATLESKVSCTRFDTSMEHLEERIQELLKHVLGQEQRWQEALQQLRDALDSKLDRRELGPFQKQLEETWQRMIKELKDEMSVIYDDAAGIKRQLPTPYKCLSCDRRLDIQVPGPHIDTLPFYPPLPISHGAHPTIVITEEQGQQHGYRMVANVKFQLKSQSCRSQDVSNAQDKDLLWVSKKPSVTKLLGREHLIDCHQEHWPKTSVRPQDKLGPAALLEQQPASDPGH